MPTEAAAVDATLQEGTESNFGGSKYILFKSGEGGRGGLVWDALQTSLSLPLLTRKNFDVTVGRGN